MFQGVGMFANQQQGGGNPFQQQQNNQMMGAQGQGQGVGVFGNNQQANTGTTLGNQPQQFGTGTGTGQVFGGGNQAQNQNQGSMYAGVGMFANIPAGPAQTNPQGNVFNQQMDKLGMGGNAFGPKPTTPQQPNNMFNQQRPTSNQSYLPFANQQGQAQQGQTGGTVFGQQAGGQAQTGLAFGQQGGSQFNQMNQNQANNPFAKYQQQQQQGQTGQQANSWLGGGGQQGQQAGNPFGQQTQQVNNSWIANAQQTGQSGNPFGQQPQHHLQGGNTWLGTANPQSQQQGNTGFMNNQGNQSFAPQQQTNIGGTAWGVGGQTMANKPPFTPLKPKNNKIDGKHVVKCIALLDQNTGFSKRQLQIRHVLTGGAVPPQQVGGGGLMTPPNLGGGITNTATGTGFQSFLGGNTNTNTNTGFLNNQSGIGQPSNNTQANNPLMGGNKMFTNTGWGAGGTTNTNTGWTAGGTNTNTNSPINTGWLAGNNTTANTNSPINTGWLAGGNTGTTNTNTNTGGWLAGGGTNTNTNTGWGTGATNTGTGWGAGNTNTGTTYGFLQNKTNNNTTAIPLGNTGNTNPLGAGWGAGNTNTGATSFLNNANNTANTTGSNPPLLFANLMPGAAGNPNTGNTGGGGLNFMNNPNNAGINKSFANFANQITGGPTATTPNFMNTTPGQTNFMGMGMGGQTTPGINQTMPNSYSYNPSIPPGLFANDPVINPATGQQFVSVLLNGMFNQQFLKQMFAAVNQTPFQNLVNQVRKNNTQQKFKQVQSNLYKKNKVYGDDSQYSIGYIPRYNKYNKAMYGSSINFNHSPYLHNDYTQDQLDTFRQSQKLKQKFFTKYDRIQTIQDPQPSMKYKQPQPILPKGFTQQLTEKAVGAPVFKNTVNSDTVNQDQLPIIPRGYKITPNLTSLKERTADELKRTMNVSIQNKYGKVIFKQAINLYKKDLSQCIQIMQDSIDIKDTEWDNKKCDLVFYDFGRWNELKNQEEKNKIQRKMRRWIEKNRMFQRSFDRNNGELHVQIY